MRQYSENDLARAACAASRRASLRLVRATTTDRADLTAELERLRDEATRARGRVLVVDDEPAVAETLAARLRARGFDPREAHSYEDGVRLLGRGPYEAVVVDVALGARSGLELARLVRTTTRARIVLWSGAVDPAALAGAGVHGVVEKGPGDLDQIVWAIRPREK